MEPFKQRIVESPITPGIELQPTETKNVVSGVEDKSIGENFDEIKHDALDDWEVQNGKYGLEYMGIKEIAKEFPMKAQFGILDNYIKGEMKERGYDMTPTKWQDILKEIETEFGTDKLNSIDRLKKLTAVIGLLKKQKEFKRKRELYAFTDR